MRSETEKQKTFITNQDLKLTVMTTCSLFTPYFFLIIVDVVDRQSQRFSRSVWCVSRGKKSSSLLFISREQKEVKVSLCLSVSRGYKNSIQYIKVYNLGLTLFSLSEGGGGVNFHQETHLPILQCCVKSTMLFIGNVARGHMNHTLQPKIQTNFVLLEHKDNGPNSYIGPKFESQ